MSSQTELYKQIFFGMTRKVMRKNQAKIGAIFFRLRTLKKNSPRNPSANTEKYAGSGVYGETINLIIKTSSVALIIDVLLLE